MGKPMLPFEVAYSRKREVSRGTETSKYPEERKSTETPLVAVSERGIAQTSSGNHRKRGCRACHCGVRNQLSIRIVWKD